MRCDTLWEDARIATMADERLGIVEDGVIAADNGVILYAGAKASAPRFDAVERVGCDGRWITPGLIDCHTHLVHGGDRAHEFELRQAGATYEEIARAGGGILSTVRATRAASAEELRDTALRRLDDLIAEGVTTIEVKSGYGLTLADERRMLRAARQLGAARRIEVVATYLGAHAVPPEYGGDADAYVDDICTTQLPALAAEGLVDAVDGFCETIGFSPAQIRRVLEAARALDLPVKLHAEQLSCQGATALAAEFGALSADHLEHVDAGGIAAMKRAGMVATLLPGAYYFLRETRLPPVAALREAEVPIALATDCNPGTSPLTSLLLTTNMAAILFRLTVEECLLGVTRHAAGALGRLDRIGTLEAGKRCDLAIWDIERPAELVHRMGANPLHARIWSGR